MKSCVHQTFKESSFKSYYIAQCLAIYMAVPCIHLHVLYHNFNFKDHYIILSMYMYMLMWLWMWARYDYCEGQLIKITCFKSFSFTESAGEDLNPTTMHMERTLSPN